MEKVIFELQFIRKVLLAPTKHTGGLFKVVDFESMDNDLSGMDIILFQEKRDRFSRLLKSSIINICTAEFEKALFGTDQQIYGNITDEQISILLELMTCYLLQCKSLECVMSIRECLLKLLIIVNVVLLGSNKKQQCRFWIRDHLSELESVRCTFGTSILHKCMNFGRFPTERLVRVLVEEGKMDVNIENTRRETPLHWLSTRLYNAERDKGQKTPTEDLMNNAEILINNGAHMDAEDHLGRQASRFFSQRFPQWSFNVSLKCLAAKALLKHGVRYEMCAPKVMIPFIESHKPKDSEEFSDKKLP